MGFMQRLEDLSNSTVKNLSQAIYGDEERYSDLSDQEVDKLQTGQSQIVEDFDNYIDGPQNRLEKYDQLEEMAKASIPSSVLTTISDDAFGIKLGGEDAVWVTAESDDVQEEATSFLKEQNIAERLRPSVENLCKYGDEFLKIDGEDGEGVKSIDWDAHPEIFRRFELDGELYGFHVDYEEQSDGYGYGATQNLSGKVELEDPWDVVHIRSGLSGQRKRIVKPGTVYEGQYGESVLEDALMDWKKLNLMEDSMVLSRYSKSRRPLFIYIDVSGYSREKKKEVFNKRKRQIRESQEFSRSGGSYQSGRDLQAKSEPIFVAVDNDRGKVEYDDMSEDVSVESIIDVEYIRDKVYGAFQVPSAFLGLEDKLPGSVGSENALMPISIRYARTVRRIQSRMLSGIKRLIRIHLAYKGTIVPADEIDVHTQSVTTAEDLTRAETAGKIINTFQTLLNLFDRGALGDVDLNEEAVAEKLIKKMNMPDLEPADFLNQDKAESKNPKKLKEAHNFFRSNGGLNDEDISAPVPNSGNQTKREVQIEEAINEVMTDEA